MEESCSFEIGHVRELMWNLIKFRNNSERVRVVIRVVISIFCLSCSEKLDEIRRKELLLPLWLHVEGKKENVLLKRYVFVE